MDLPRDRRVTKKQVMEIFQISNSTIASWLYKKDGKHIEKPRASDNTFDIITIADYILGRSSRGRGKTQLRSQATIIKKHYISEGLLEAPTKKKSPTKKIKVETEVGIEHAVARARRFEAEFAREVDDAMGDPASLANNLNNWNKTLEILRKTEESCLKILEEKRDLVRMSEVRDLYSKGILPVKTRLMALPVQLAPQLVDQELPTITEILTKAFTKVLADCADIWGDEK